MVARAAAAIGRAGGGFRPLDPYLIGIAGLVSVCAVIGLTVARPSALTLLAVAAPVGAMFVALAMLRTSTLLLAYPWVLFLLSGIVSDRVRTYGMGRLFTFIPVQVGYLGDVILIALMASVILRVLVHGKLPARPGRFDALIGLLGLVAAFSIWVNAVPAVTAVAAVRLLLEMVGPYFILRYGAFAPGTFDKLLTSLWYISLLQFPLVALQYAAYLWLGWSDDLVAGTFSRVPKLLAFQLAFFALGMGAYATNLQGVWRKRLLWTCGLAAAGLGFTSARIGFFLFPLIAAIVCFQLFWKRPVHALKLGLAGLLLSAIGTSLYVTVVGGPSEGQGRELLYYMQNPAAVRTYFFANPDEWDAYEGRLSRGGALVYLWRYLDRYPGGRVLGVGPGMATPFDYGSSAGQNSLFISLGTSITQAGAMMSEMGVAGLGLSVLIVLAGIHLGRRHDGDPPLVRAVRAAFPGYAVAFLLMQMYGRVWYEAESAFTFWFFAVLLLKFGGTSSGPAPAPAAATGLQARG